MSKRKHTQPTTPIRVRVESAGIVMVYTLSSERLQAVWKTLNECHALDSAKERLCRAIEELAHTT